MMALWISQYTENPHTQTSIWTLTLTTISNSRGLWYEHSLTANCMVTKPEQKDSEVRHVKSALKANGYKEWAFTIPHPKNSPTLRVTPQGARPHQRGLALYQRYIRKTGQNIKKPWSRGLPQSLQHHGLHAGPPQRQDTWSQKVWCRLWNPVSRLPCTVCRWNCPHTGDKDEKPRKTAVGDHEHPIKMDDVKVIALEDSMWRRKIRKSIEIRTRLPAINRDQGYELLPPPPPHLWWTGTAVMWPPLRRSRDLGGLADKVSISWTILMTVKLRCLDSGCFLCVTKQEYISLINDHSWQRKLLHVENMTKRT